MKIGIPIWEDKISPVLDTASRLLVVETEGQKESSRFETCLDVRDNVHRCFRIQGLGVDILICGAVSRRLLEKLMALGMQIIPGISGHPEVVLKAYLQGNIDDARFLMPGFKR
ncbi:MAG: NifB/NifX family molybdenum-iron cluster-binding protein [Deltaproteobacteria bacterium]|nr:NifB/NifX family molybdenum-iron cluster-binding protein [Deltaproteobacteria bacterium]